MKKKFNFILIVFLFSFSTLFAQIDSQWRGPNRDGVFPNESLLKLWPKDGPELLWDVDGLGAGYSSPAVTSNRVYVTGMTKGAGFLIAFDMNGKQVWRRSYGSEWSGSSPGARTAPTVVGRLIYLMSGECQVVCLSTEGKVVWSKNLMQDFGARNIEWGMTESLLVDGDRVFCTPGGSDTMMAALDRFSGKTIWTIKGNSEKSGYCSPRLVKHGQRRLILTMTAKSVVGIDADTGEFLWQHSHVTEYDVNANTPLYKDGYIYTVSGYDTGGQMFQLSEDGKSITRIWAKDTLDSQMGAVILFNGFIYGSGHQNRGWYCLDWKTGEVQFSAREVGNKGAIIFGDGLLYCYSERGDVALVKPNPQKFEVLSSFRITKGSDEHWAHPVIAKGRLYIRHGNTLMVYNIAR